MYPVNPDTGTNSILLADETAQVAKFGRAISIAECVVPNPYVEIDLFGKPSLRNFSYVTEVDVSPNSWNDEATNNNQQSSQADFLSRLKDYYVNIAMANMDIAIIVITDIKIQPMIFDTTGINGKFQVMYSCTLTPFTPAP